MKSKHYKRSAILVLPILCINFGLNLHRLQFDHLTVSTMVTNFILLLHPLLIGIILYRLGKCKEVD